jgi:membrane protein YqaA with SNARE-associated domain
MLNPSARKGTLVVWIIGAVCLVVGQIIGWWLGYGRGKKDALQAVGRMEEYNQRRKITANQNKNKNKGSVKAGQGSPGPARSGQGRNKKR